MSWSKKRVAVHVDREQADQAQQALVYEVVSRLPNNLSALNDSDDARYLDGVQRTSLLTVRKRVEQPRKDTQLCFSPP